MFLIMSRSLRRRVSVSVSVGQDSTFHLGPWSTTLTTRATVWEQRLEILELHSGHCPAKGPNLEILAYKSPTVTVTRCRRLLASASAIVDCACVMNNASRRIFGRTFSRRTFSRRTFSKNGKRSFAIPQRVVPHTSNEKHPRRNAVVFAKR